VEEWLTKPGLPAGAPRPSSDAFQVVKQAAAAWAGPGVPAVDTKNWNTHQWLHFLRALRPTHGTAKMAQLDRAYRLTESGNAEILHQWLKMAIQSGYQPAFPKVEQFLTTVGRRKFLKPLYEELVKTPAGRERAEAIFARARPGYHPIAAASVEEILKGVVK
jgi:hypothetical protein